MPLSITLIVQAEGPECPFGLLFAPCRGAEVLSQGTATWTWRTGAPLTVPKNRGTQEIHGFEVIASPKRILL